MGIVDLWCEVISDGRDVMCINVLEDCETGVG